MEEEIIINEVEFNEELYEQNLIENDFSGSEKDERGEI